MIAPPPSPLVRASSTDRYLSPEFRLLLACCETPRPAPATLERLVTAITDWPAFDGLTVHHRVPGFVQQALSPFAPQIPEAAWRRMTEQARRNADRNLRNFAEEVRVDRAFRAHAIAPLFLKGASLGMKLYGNLTTKSSWDIDVVVPPDRVADSADILRSLGYVSTGFCGIDSGPMFDRFLAVAMESIWHDSTRGTYLELHSRMTNYPVLLDGLSDSPDRQTIAGSGSETLADGALFAYLCVHGTMHSWERLKWLADVAALVATSRLGVERLLGAAEAAGAGRPAIATLSLCAELLSLPLPDAIRERCRSASAARRLAEAGRTTLTTAGGDLHAGPLAPIRSWSIQISSVAGARRKAAMAWSIVAGLRWPFQLRLPRPLWPVAAILISPVRLYQRWLHGGIDGSTRH